MKRVRTIATGVILALSICVGAICAGAAEIVLTPEDMEGCEVVFAEADAIVPYSSAITVHWTVPANTTYKTVIFHKYSGDTVIVDVTLTGAMSYCYVGVMEPVDQFYCVATMTSCSQTFTIHTSGYCSFAVYNPTSSEVKVDGTYEK